MPFVYPDNELSYPGKFLEHAVPHDGKPLPAQPDFRARARRSLYPARRSRAELFDQHDSQRG